ATKKRKTLRGNSGGFEFSDLHAPGANAAAGCTNVAEGRWFKSSPRYKKTKDPQRKLWGF
ncbi:MAG TPA: hypothetical protein PLF40_24895, partial [Kofleriaceae bacterium]|nr:hypothetical protein [Kofleriaceae bacterium]